MKALMKNKEDAAPLSVGAKSTAQRCAQHVEKGVSTGSESHKEVNALQFFAVYHSFCAIHLLT